MHSEPCLGDESWGNWRLAISKADETLTGLTEVLRSPNCTVEMKTVCYQQNVWAAGRDLSARLTWLMELKEVYCTEFHDFQFSLILQALFDPCRCHPKDHQGLPHRSRGGQEDGSRAQSSERHLCRNGPLETKEKDTSLMSQRFLFLSVVEMLSCKY